MINNMVVSLVKYSLCAIMSTLTTPVFSLGWLLSSIPMSTDWLTSSDKRENWTCTQSRLQSTTKPGYVHNVSYYNPVNVWPRIRQSGSALAFCSDHTSTRFRVNIRIVCVRATGDPAPHFI